MIWQQDMVYDRDNTIGQATVRWICFKDTWKLSLEPNDGFLAWGINSNYFTVYKAKRKAYERPRRPRCLIP